jgi:hypothetical protein
MEYFHRQYCRALLLRLTPEARDILKIRVRFEFRARAHATLHRAEVRVMLQRWFVCFFGFGLLFACGSGKATDPPTLGSQDPVPNPNSAVAGNAQSAPTPKQRPAPVNDGVPVFVGPIATSGGSGGGASAQGGGNDNGGRRGDNGGTGNSGGTGDAAACSTSDFCANCDPDNCQDSCNCLKQLGSTVDCVTLCN